MDIGKLTDDEALAKAESLVADAKAIIAAVEERMAAVATRIAAMRAEIASGGRAPVPADIPPSKADPPPRRRSPKAPGSKSQVEIVADFVNAAGRELTTGEVEKGIPSIQDSSVRSHLGTATKKRLITKVRRGVFAPKTTAAPSDGEEAAE